MYLFFTSLLFICLFLGRHSFAKRVTSLFHKKTPTVFFLGLRVILGLLLFQKLVKAYVGNISHAQPTSFLRIDLLFDFFFYSELRVVILLLIPLVFITLLACEIKPRFTSLVLFIYSVIAGTMMVTLSGSLGVRVHTFHMISLLLLGLAFYYWFYYKRDVKKSYEWIVIPICLFFISTIYTSSAFSKFNEINEVTKWFTGEAIQSAFIKGHYQRAVEEGFQIGMFEPLQAFVINHKAFAALLGAGALLTEFSSLFLLIASPPLRLLILVLLIVLNVFSGFLFLPVYFTSNIFLLIYLSLWATYDLFQKRKRHIDKSK